MEQINKPLARVLDGLVRPALVAVGSKEQHQSKAMECARLVRESYSEESKRKARSACLAHLRASLCASAATEVGTGIQLTGGL